MKPRREPGVRHEHQSALKGRKNSRDTTHRVAFLLLGDQVFFAQEAQFHPTFDRERVCR
jgi:hypothetical protein